MASLPCTGPSHHRGPAACLGKNVYIDEGVTIGADCKIQNNVSVFKGVTLGDEVFVGPSAVFTNDLLPRADEPRLGDHTYHGRTQRLHRGQRDHRVRCASR